jgi:hypothetical protein
MCLSGDGDTVTEEDWSVLLRDTKKSSPEPPTPGGPPGTTAAMGASRDCSNPPGGTSSDGTPRDGIPLSGSNRLPVPCCATDAQPANLHTVSNAGTGTANVTLCGWKFCALQCIANKKDFGSVLA